MLIILHTQTDKLKPVKVEKNLNEYLASLSITPKEPTKVVNNETSVITLVNIDIHTIFDENYQQSVKELSMLIKDKVKLINVK